MKNYQEYIVEKNVNSTLDLIKTAHAGQKYGNQPYWTHPNHVANFGKTIFGSKFGPSETIVALLHDVIEDTEHTRDSLLEFGYSEKIVDAVELLTKDSSLDYEGNIRRIISSGNKTAMMVKFADNYVNYTGDKSNWDSKRAAKSNAKYLKSMHDLGDKLGVDVDQVLKDKK